jgi:hypothetical protein
LLGLYIIGFDLLTCLFALVTLNIIRKRQDEYIDQF